MKDIQGPQECIELSERSQCEKATYYTTPTMTVWESQDNGNGKKISGCCGWADTGGTKRVFRAIKYSV